MMLRLASLFLAASAAFPQTAELTGRVLDPSGAVVGGARVIAELRDGSGARHALTDALGAFRFSGLAPASYLLRAEAAGFQPASLVALEITPGSSVTRDLQLELARLTSRFVVTASATAQSTDETAKAFDLIDAAEMERRAEFSLVEALRLTPGLRVMQLGGPGSLARVHARGLRAFDTSVLIDGFRFRDSSAPQGDATGFLADLLVIESDRVEVLRGSGSSLYGTNAIGGVVNVVTAPGGGPLRGEVTAEGGGLGLARGVARLSGAARGDRLRFSAGLAHLNVTRGLDGDDRHRNSSAQGYARYQLAPRSAVSLRLWTNDTFLGLNTPPSAASGALPTALPVPARESSTFVTSLNDPDSRRASRFYSTLLGFTHQWTPGVSLRAQYQALSNWRDNRDGPGGAGFQPQFPSANRFDGRIDTALIRSDVAARGHLFSFGYEFERENYDNRSTDDNPDPALRPNARVEVSQASHALFAQHQWRLAADRLQISLSGRHQRFDLSRPRFTGGGPRYQGVALGSPPPAWTGDTALSYFLRPSGTKLRAHLGNSYRAPTLYERFGYSFFLGSFTAFGDPRLAPERALSADAGFDQYLAGSRVRLSATGFYSRLQQVIGFDFSGLIQPATDPFGRSYGYRNTGGGLSRGAEISAEVSLARNTRFTAAYTYTNADERYSTLLGGSLRSIRVSDHMVTGLLTHRFGRHIDITADLFAASEYWFPFFAGGSRPFAFPGPRKADLVVSYTRPLSENRRLRLFTRIDNLLNRTYFEDGFRTPGVWAVAGLQLSF